MRYRPVAIMVVTLSILSNACPPAAATSFRIFSDRVSFNDAAQPRSLIGFEEFPEGQVCPLHVGTDPCGLLTQGVEFVATTYMEPISSPGLRIESDFGLPLSRGLGSDAIPVAANDFYWNFMSQSLGLDVVTGATNGRTYTVVLTDQFDAVFQFSMFATNGAGGFFGFISDVPIRSMSIFDPCLDRACFIFLIDNVVVSPVPEPSSLCLLGFASAVLFLAGHRRAYRSENHSRNKLQL